MMKTLLFNIFFLFTIVCYSQNNEQNIIVGKEDYYSIARDYHLGAKNDSAMIMINKGLEVADSTDYLNRAKMYIFRGVLYGNTALFEQSMEDAIRALTISEQHHLKETKASALLCIGKIHYMMYNDDLAEEFILKAHEVAEENQLKKELIETTSALAEFYTIAEKPDLALPLHEKALGMSREIADTINIIKTLTSLGDYYINLNRWTNPVIKEHQIGAKKYFDEAMNLASDKQMQLHINNINLSLIRWCRVEKDYRRGLSFAQEILNTADPNNYTLLLQVYNYLVALYAHLEDTDNVIQSHNQFYSLMMKQSGYKMHQALQEMEVKYETAAKELQIEKQQTEIKRQKNRSYILLLAFSVTILIVILLFLVIRLNRKRNKELKEINATKDKFFSIISHDLKNPAIAQRNALQMISENWKSWDEKTLAEFISELIKSSGGQLELINNLLNWAQTQTGGMPYRPINFDLNAALRVDMNLIHDMAARKNICFTTDIPEDIIIYGDKNMMVTIIRNLLNNAVKFTNPGGSVSLIIKPEEKEYEIIVKDTGIGMDENLLKNLFKFNDQFFKREMKKEQGSGFGLLVCKEMIEKHESKIIVESEEGKGSCFSFKIKR